MALKYDSWEMDCNEQKLILRLNGKLVDDISFDSVAEVYLHAQRKQYQEFIPKEKPKFKCWSCKKIYSKVVHEAGWTCPLCGIWTGGTGSRRDEKTGAILTLPPIKEE